MESHKDAVGRLQKEVKHFYKRGIPFRIYHGGTNSTRTLTFKRSEMVDVSRLNHVLSVDPIRGVALVEPNVPMDQLVKETLKYGLVPPVVTEFPGITVGGAIQGTAAETSSFKWGCFSQTINWAEIILGDGSQLKVSRDNNADLFFGMAGSFGSLGLVTAAEVQLIEAKKYVNVSHHKIGSFKEGTRLLNKYSKSDYDFIECIMFSKNHGTVVAGRMSNKAAGKIRRFSRPFDSWYYLYLKKVAASGSNITETIPLKDYLFRFNRGAFWAAEYALKQSHIPFNAFTRLVLDPLLRTRKLYHVLQESAAGQIYVCQDLVLPPKTVLPFLEFVDKEFSTYPVGIWAIKPESRSKLQCNGIDADMVFSVGVYGLRVEPYEEFIKVNRLIESQTKNLGGRKWLYAHNYYTEKEFWQIYDNKWYRNLRTKYKASTLPDIFTRTSVKDHFRVSKRRGAIKTILGLAKLRIID